MKYYEVYQNRDSIWMIYEVTEYGQCYKLIKTFKTRKGAESWAKKQWYRVIWR